MPIPKIIHQIWYQGEDEIPDKYKVNIESWKMTYPEFEYRFWDEYDIRKLLMNYYPWFMSTWESYKFMHQRIDSAKYFILDHIGGLYVDTDVFCVKSCEDFFNKYDLILTEYDMNAERNSLCLPVAVATLGRHWSGPYCNNGIFASKKGHPLWKSIHSSLIKSNGAMSAFGKVIEITFTTGPSFFTNVIRDNGYHILESTLVAPPDYFEPVSIKQHTQLNGNIQITPNTYAVHNYSLTWLNRENPWWVYWLLFVKHHWRPVTIAGTVMVLIVIFVVYRKFFSGSSTSLPTQIAQIA